MGTSRATVIGVHTEFDRLLSVVAPIGLAAAAARPALVIDLDPEGPGYPGARSLAELVEEGPTRAELFPRLPGALGPGVALLRNGGIDWRPAVSIIEALAKQWPALVLRLPDDGDPGPGLRFRWSLCFLEFCNRSGVGRQSGSRSRPASPTPLAPVRYYRRWTDRN